MYEDDEIEYGIKYRVIKLEEDKYILFPISVEQGIETEDGFRTTKNKLIPYAYEVEDLDNSYVMDMICTKDELQFVYEYDGEEEFLLDYFYDDFKNTLIFIDTDPKKGYMSRNEINLDIINSDNVDLTYVMDKSFPSIVLNEAALDEILSCEDVYQVRLLLSKYKQLIQTFQEFNSSKGVTKINVSNGKIESVELKKKVKSDNQREQQEKSEDFSSIPIVSVKDLLERDISFRGLKQYLLERIFGHDEAITTFAQKLYMNCTAEEGETVESILLVGPTGTGKTETVNAACEYLGLPYVENNASNIVPQGIKGICIEEIIANLYERANYDIEKTQRGLVFLDEFDKLNETDLELKTSVKNILLTFTAGGNFPIDTDRFTFNFNSTMTNKVYAGVFDRITHQKRDIGFGRDIREKESLGTEDELREKIISKGYFSLEELSRISTLLPYSELDRETKKRILLKSKLSELAKKKNRYRRQFQIDLIASDDYIEAVLDSVPADATGMRSVNNIVKRNINSAEQVLLESEHDGYKRLILTRDTVENPRNFDLS